MSAEHSISDATAEELASLFQEYGYGLTQDQMEQSTEPLGVLKTAPQAFQFRVASHKPWQKNDHIRKLVRALARQEGLFDPILLIAVAGQRIVLDGHCRLAAYREAELPPSTPVPVSYFQGEFSDALLRPAGENSKAKLPLTQEEQLEAAWRLVCFDEDRGRYSLRQIARETGAGKSTVANMRDALKDDHELDFDPRRKTWKEVKRGRQEQRDVDPEWPEKRARTWAKRVRRALGGKPNATPECLFRALEIAFPQIVPHRIPRDWFEESDVGQAVYERRVMGADDFEF